jgi:hypothetical protein
MSTPMPTFSNISKNTPLYEKGISQEQSIPNSASQTTLTKSRLPGTENRPQVPEKPQLPPWDVKSTGILESVGLKTGAISAGIGGVLLTIGGVLLTISTLPFIAIGAAAGLDLLPIIGAPAKGAFSFASNLWEESHLGQSKKEMESHISIAEQKLKKQERIDPNLTNDQAIQQINDRINAYNAKYPDRKITTILSGVQGETFKILENEVIRAKYKLLMNQPLSSEMNNVNALQNLNAKIVQWKLDFPADNHQGTFSPLQSLQLPQENVESIKPREFKYLVRNIKDSLINREGTFLGMEITDKDIAGLNENIIKFLIKHPNAEVTPLSGTLENYQVFQRMNKDITAFTPQHQKEFYSRLKLLNQLRESNESFTSTRVQDEIAQFYNLILEENQHISKENHTIKKEIFVLFEEYYLHNKHFEKSNFSNEDVLFLIKGLISYAETKSKVE